MQLNEKILSCWLLLRRLKKRFPSCMNIKGRLLYIYQFVIGGLFTRASDNVSSGMKKGVGFAMGKVTSWASQRPVLSVQTLPALLCPDQRICSDTNLLSFAEL